MIGRSAVIMQMPHEEITFTEWIEEKVIQVCREAFSGDAESGHFFQVWMDNSIAVPLSEIKAFLGDTETLHGGTIGEPIIQPDYVEKLYELLTDGLASIAKCAVPEYLVLNNMEIRALTIANYIWHAFVKDPDPLGMQ